jgi:hypothetical protein
VTEILTEPVSAPNVWRGDELADVGRWIIHFTEEDFADFERALAHVSKKHFEDVTGIRPEDFPLSHFQERIDDVVDRLEHGLGLVLLRGLPIYNRFSEDEATIIYWGLGRHMGNLVPQNHKGDLVGHTKDLGRRGPYERAYATNEDLGFHTDSTDFVGLMCLRPALYGGESFVASSGLLYNFVVGEHPEYLPILNKSFPTDWRSEEPPGSPGWYLEPLYSYFGGALSATVGTGRAMSAMRFHEVPRLTADEVACFMYFDSLPKRHRVAVPRRLLRRRHDHPRAAFGPAVAAGHRGDHPGGAGGRHDHRRYRRRPGRDPGCDRGQVHRRATRTTVAHPMDARHDRPDLRPPRLRRPPPSRSPAGVRPGAVGVPGPARARPGVLAVVTGPVRVRARRGQGCGSGREWAEAEFGALDQPRTLSTINCMHAYTVPR